MMSERRTKAVLYAACAAVFLLPCARAEDFVLAERGKPAACTIVLPAAATEVQRYAAEELRDFTERMTGVRLSVVEGGDADGRSVVFLDAGERNPKMDGFVIDVSDRRLSITASSRRGGCLYAVYEILERFGGCRWYSSWCEKIPKRDRLSVPAPLQEVHEPAFDMRQPWWYDALSHHAFAARLRMNTHQWGRMEPKYGGEHFRFGRGLGSCHTFEALVPIGKYGESHPEYFALRGGKRRNKPVGPIQYYAQLCLTNPDVLDLVAAGVLKAIRADPDAKFYGVSQNDNPKHCECEKCAAVDAEEESHAGTVVRFVNAVAERVEREYPNVLIETLAYQFSRKPPKKTRLRKNVVPCLCSIECDFARSIATSGFAQNRSFREDIRGWRKMTDQLYLWDYTTDFANYPMPFANVYVLQDNIRFFRDEGVRYLFEQGDYQGPHADFAELKAWLQAKWMWNPELPAQALLDDFFAGYYGAGALFVRAYFEELHRLQLAYSSSGDHPLCIFDGCDNKAIPDSFLTRAAALFERAAAAVADDPTCAYNVKMASFSVDYMRLERLRRRTQALVSFDPDYVQSEDFLESRRLVRKALAHLQSVKGLRLREHGEEKLVGDWRSFLAQTPRQPAGGKVELEEKDMTLANRGKWGEFADDPLAADGKAIKMFNSHYEWCTMLPLSKVVFRTGRTYRIRARVRVEREEGAKGEAFWAGVYDEAAKRGRGGIEPKVADVGEGYVWYDVATWIPGGGSYFWIGPGRFDAQGGGRSAVKAVWLDKIEISEVPVNPGKGE